MRDYHDETYPEHYEYFPRDDQVIPRDYREETSIEVDKTSEVDETSQVDESSEAPVGLIVLIGFVIAAIVGVVVFALASSHVRSQVHSQNAAWGKPTSCQAKMVGFASYGNAYRDVRVDCPNYPVQHASILEDGANVSFINVWKNAKSGEIFVAGDDSLYSHGTSTDGTPIHSPDLVGPFILGLLAWVVLFAGIVSISIGASKSRPGP